MADLKDLREKRGKAIHDMRAIMEKARGEGRDTLTKDEDQQYQRAFQAQEELRAQIEREERLAEIEREALEGAGTRAEEERGKGKQKTPVDLQMDGFRSFLRSGHASGEAGEAFRALQANANTQGGFLVAPEQFVNELIKAVDNMVFVRGRATKFSVATAQSLGAPSLDADPDDADWTAELGTGSEDSAMAFGKRELHPHPLAKRLKVSNKLMRAAMMNPEQLVRDRLAYKFGVTQEKAFLTGSGANQPLGLFTASSNGISTGRDVATDNTATSISFNGLISAKYALKSQYHGNAAWMFHRDAMAQISKLTDSNGQYLWRESVREGEPDRILGLPAVVSEYVPNTFTTGKYVGILGDYSFYWIADALDMQIQRLNELYAETNQVGFIGRLETDGMPVLEEAFVRVKLA